jgi:hypothetical protein
VTERSNVKHSRVPKYRLQCGSGQALVQTNGRSIYFGKHRTPESKERYRRILAEHFADPVEVALPLSSGTVSADSATRLGKHNGESWRWAISGTAKTVHPPLSVQCADRGQ